MFSSPIASYRQIDVESDIHGADPHRLIVLLFDGAESALHRAQACIVNNDNAGRSEAILKAIDIILMGLSSSLNVEEGGELAQNLKALYDYMVSRLIHANLRKDPRAIREVQGLLGEISGAWREMGQKKRQEGSQNPEQNA
ncbi:flagellar export chaperone FliS [Ferribacterium limneticum]|uniref:flagellar export chaperone FliS n=1 Tax=Ferribacterium limneticum TaxID=76259 RepID=UPI001CFB3B44|nr:flagellar export chaperone FliS [Ferribacterium limneticum]UCV19771.1 flagellar export chaperone FliS [Ferribacterium limneticum]